MSQYFIALSITLLIEFAVLLVLHKMFDWTKLGWVVQFGIGLNLISHPLAWTARSIFAGNFWLLEIAVIMFEAFGWCWFFRVAGIRAPVSKALVSKAIAISLVMNTASMLAGLAIMLH